MVEQELMQIVQMFSQIATATGVCFAAYYYVMTLRNTDKIRRKDIMFQIQAPRSPEYYAIFSEVANMYDYKTIEDYQKKYTEEQRQKANYLYIHFNMLGVLLKDGIASAEEIFQLYPTYTMIRLWEVFETHIKGLREVTKQPDFCEPFEMLYKEARKKNPDYIVPHKRVENPKN